MPQDPNLYGQKRPAKKQKREMALASSLDFTSQLTSLMSKPTTSSSPTAVPSSSAGRPRPSKSKDIFSGIKAKRKDSSGGATTSTKDGDSLDPRRLRLRSPTGTEEGNADLVRARRKMEEKARLYAAMQRGDYVSKEGEAAPLVDFDRKWAEKHLDVSNGGYVSSSGSDSEEDDEDDEDYKDTELVEYTDEFGRLRKGTRAEAMRLERRRKRGELSALELERMSARPRAPGEIIFGDTVQAEAFRPEDPEGMEAGARKRDRSLTPPEAVHYEADREIRTKGTGFYAFSKDEATRMEEMRSLEEERARTEEARAERKEKLEARRLEIQERRKKIGERRREMGERRAKEMADTFLDGLEKDFLGSVE